MKNDINKTKISIISSDQENFKLNLNSNLDVSYRNNEALDNNEKEPEIINIDNEIIQISFSDSSAKMIVEKRHSIDVKQNTNNYEEKIIINNSPNLSRDFINKLPNNYTNNNEKIINEISIVTNTDKTLISNETKIYNQNKHLDKKKFPEDIPYALSSEKLLNYSEIENEADPQNKTSAQKTVLGFIILLLIVVLTVTSSIIIKIIEGNIKPFLFTYLNYNFFIVYLLIDFIKKKIKKCLKRKRNLNESEEEYFRINKDAHSDSRFSKAMRRFNSEIEIGYAENFVYFTIVLCLLWYSTNALYNYALTFTSITSVNSLSSSNIIFVLIFEFFFLIKVKNRNNFFTLFKFFALLSTFSGIMLIAFYDKNNTNKNDSDVKNNENDDDKTSKNSLLGVLLGLSSAFCYAAYSVYFKIQTKKYKSNFNITQTFGFIGVFNLLIIPFLLVLLHFTKIEIFVMPTSNDLFYVFLNALTGVTSDFLIGCAIMLLTPDVVSFGMTMTIPLSFVFDIFIKKNFVFQLLYFFGILAIIVGFSLIATESYIKYVKNKKEIIRI